MKWVRLIWSTGQTGDVFMTEGDLEGLETALCSIGGPPAVKCGSTTVSLAGLKLVIDVDAQVQAGTEISDEAKKNKRESVALRADAIVAKLTNKGQP